jgi:UDP-N-acetylglucosamine 2-epimerase (non-hydrolysing)
MKLIGIVFGTRPEVIKLVPVIARLRAADWCKLALLPTGQHGHLLRQAMSECGLPPMPLPPPPLLHDPARLVRTLTQRARLMFDTVRPRLVLVHGDTATALAGAQAAVELGIPVGHVEAGLRTYDLQNPYPEEQNRQTIARLAQLHFAPTPAARCNLLGEGIAPASVFMTGNTTVDMLQSVRLAAGAPIRDGERLAVVTLHRRELVPSIDQVVAGLSSAVECHPDLRVVIPLHHNPAIAQPLRAAFGHHPRIELIAALPYPKFLALLASASVVVTDSGGVQEEAAILGVPLVVARRLTERPEVLTSGRGVVTGFDAAAIQQAVGWALGLGPATGLADDSLGDGHAADRIEMVLKDFLCRPSHRPIPPERRRRP